MADIQSWLPERAALWESLVTDWSSDTSSGLEISGASALGLALGLDACLDPNAEVDRGPGRGGPQPVVHLVLRRLLDQRRSDRWAASRNNVRAEISLDPGTPAPPALGHLLARERLAVWLLRSGANPWVRDADGMDALDWAVLAGARSVASALMKDARCPPPEELSLRTPLVSGRRLPWLHTLVFLGRMEMLGDLVDAGLDSGQLDKNGWPMAAWLSTADDFKALATKGLLPETGLRATLEHAWVRRNVQKLFEGSFPLTELQKLLSESFSVSPEDRASSQTEQWGEEWLSPKGFFSHSEPGGAYFSLSKAVAVKTALVEQRAWRKKIRAGTLMKGQWSLLGALMVATLNNNQSRPEQLFVSAEGVVEVLRAWPEEDLNKWLDESIRPGLTNRGLLVLFMGPHSDPWLAERWGSHDCVLEEATEASLALAGASDSRRMMLRRRWTASAGSWGGCERVDAVWFSSLLKLAGSGMLSLPAKECAAVFNQVETAVRNGQDPMMFRLAWQLLRQPPRIMVTNAMGHQEDAHLVSLAALWTALDQAWSRAPDCGASALDYPFTYVKSNDLRFPCAEAWAAHVRSRLLEHGVVRTDLSPKASRPRI